ncbi:30S ribosome-binding factor RbfA [Rhodobacteraceae bacterium]|nr:30S ribosome-binding factor RbfA [Paracoccaceae bacterium]
MARAHINEGPARSQRQLRVAEVIRRRLSEVLMQGDIHDPDLNRLSITVGEVVCSNDLKIATAYVLPLGGNDRELALEMLRRNRYEIRRAVGKGVALKYSPEIRFQIDETFDRLDDTRAMFLDENVRRDIDPE